MSRPHPAPCILPCQVDAQRQSIDEHSQRPVGAFPTLHAAYQHGPEYHRSLARHLAQYLSPRQMEQTRGAYPKLPGLGAQAQVQLTVQCQAALSHVAAIALHIQQAERQRRFVDITEQFAEERFMVLAAHTQAGLGHIVAIRNGDIELASLAQQMCLHVVEHNLQRRMVEDHMMEQQDRRPPLVGLVFGENQPQQWCLTHVQPRMARVEALLQLLHDRPFKRIEFDLLHRQLSLTTDDLHRCFQALPLHRSTQDVVAINHTLQGADKGVQARTVSNLKHRLQDVRVACFCRQMVIENPLLQRRQRVDILHIRHAAGHAGDNEVDGGLIEIG